MPAFLTGTVLAALFATGMYFALDGFTVDMVEAYDDRSVLAHEIRNEAGEGDVTPKAD